MGCCGGQVISKIYL